MQKACLSDNCYNITKQLSKKLEFLSHVNKYIEDARKGNDKEAETIWNTIKTDEEKHADMLHNLLLSEAKHNKL